MNRTYYPSIGERKIRIAVFFETGKMIQEHLNNTLVWFFFSQLPPNIKNMLYVEAVTAKQVKNNVLLQGNFDMIILPGGDAEDNCSYLGSKGREKIVNFVSEFGRGYLGICAGSYLALTPCKDNELLVDNLIKKKVLDYPTKQWHWGLIPGITSGDLGHWNRGSGHVQCEFTKDGKRILNSSKNESEIYYANGPLLYPIRNAEINPNVKVLATYKTELCRIKGSQGKMINTPSIIINEFGKKKGRVAVCSPHLEKYPNDENTKYLINLIIWVSKSNKTLI